MKNLNSYILLLALAILFNSCDEQASKQKAEPNTPPTEELKITDEEIASCDEIQGTNKIHIDTAIKYISRFWTDPEGMPFGEKYGAGSYVPFDPQIIDAKSDKTVPPYYGYSFYSGIKTFGADELFISVKKDIVCPGITDPQSNIKINDKFYSLKSNFDIIPRTSRTEYALKQYLRDEFKVKSGEVASTMELIPTKDVFDANEIYKEAWKGARNYGNYGFGFFRSAYIYNIYDQPDLRAIGIDPTINGFACFLGYIPEKPSEKVRIVLIPVNQNGKLLLHPETYCVEKSWPPIGPSKKDNPEAK